MTGTHSTPGGAQARPSIGELVSTLSEKMSQLVRDEIALAKLELAEKAKHAGIGAALFAVAGLLGLFALGVLITTAILGIIEAGLAPWLAALIVAVALLVIAAILAAAGKKALDKGTPPVPERAQASIKADVAAVKEGLHS